MSKEELIEEIVKNSEPHFYMFELLKSFGRFSVSSDGWI